MQRNNLYPNMPMLDADNRQKMSNTFGAFLPFLPVVRTFNSLKIHLYFFT